MGNKGRKPKDLTIKMKNSRFSFRKRDENDSWGPIEEQ